MLVGKISVPMVNESSVCRICEKYALSTSSEYRIHSTTLLPSVQFGRSMNTPKVIDSSIFANVDETSLSFAYTVYTQNYLSTKFMGRTTYIHSGGIQHVKQFPMGTEFRLVCRGGNPSKSERYFTHTDEV